MDIYLKIDDILRYLTGIEEDDEKKTRLKVYLEGVKTKLMNAEYSLNRIKELDSQPKYNKDSTVQDSFTIDDKIQCYVESFFAFLFSAFDVVSHVINQKYGFFNDENKVKFYKTLSKLEEINSNNPLYISSKRISKLKNFKELRNYRNCATHRRDIFIGKRGGTLPSRAYEDCTQDLEIPRRVLADNPLVIMPKTTKDRDLVEYSEGMFIKACEYIDLILRRIKEIY